MPTLYDIHWLPDGPVEAFAGSRGNSYVLGPSERLDLRSAPVWCHACADISHGEKVPTLDEIDRDLRDIHDPATDVYQLTHAGVPADFAANAVAKLHRRRRWREARRSPPKCIGCGSSNIVVLPFDRPVNTPLGLLVLRVVGWCSVEPNDWLFTPEGDRIRPPVRRDWRRAACGPWRWLRSKVTRVGPAAG